jgi:large subunit ribosomal protein L19
VRRAKLYYRRGLTGTAARISEKKRAMGAAAPADAPAAAETAPAEAASEG